MIYICIDITSNTIISPPKIFGNLSFHFWLMKHASFFLGCISETWFLSRIQWWWRLLEPILQNSDWKGVMLSLIRTCWTTIAPHFNHWLISWWWIMVHVGVASRFPQMQKLPERHWKVPWNFWQVEVDTNKALGDQDCSIYEDVFILRILYIYIYTYTYDYTHSMYIHELCVYNNIYVCFHSQTIAKGSIKSRTSSFQSHMTRFF